MNDNKDFLTLENITKDFSGTQVLQGVNFSLKRGEIIGLVGENGAGKTTLMSILFGMPVINDTGGYGGRILIEGKEVKFKSPFDALDAGIGMVHQEFSLIPGFSATENIMLNRELQTPSILSDLFTPRLSLLKRKEMNERAQAVLNELGVSIDAHTLISEMPVGHKQFTEIAREIDICDRVVILRDGKTIQDKKTSEITIPEIAAGMVGREISNTEKKDKDKNIGPVVLDVKNLWVDMPGEIVRNVNFSVNEGEIFGIGGLAGQGKVGIPNGIMGIFPAGGTVTFKGKELSLNNTKQALLDGLAFVSEDRRGVGLLLDESLEWNIAFTAIQSKRAYLKSYLGGLLKIRDEKAMKSLADKYIDMLQIRCTGSHQKAKELSGGNQQKICLAKAFCLEPEILFVAEPTRGIDVGAKALVLDALRKINKELGTTIIMISSELEELRSVCDRVAIVFHGEISGILPPEEKPAEFALYMAGVK